MSRDPTPSPPPTGCRLDSDQPLRIGIFTAAGLGDGLIALTLAQALQARGHTVTLVNDRLGALAPLIPDLALESWPEPTRLRAAVSRFDRAIAMDYTRIADEHESYPDVQVLWEHHLDHGESMVANYRRAAEVALGVQIPDQRPALAIPQGWAFRAHPRRVAIHPQSMEPERDWSPGRFQALAARLGRTGFEPCFLVSSAQRAAWLEREADPLETRDVLEAARIIYESGYLIGVDSGLGHLASALGIPTLTIACHDLALLWRPGWGGELCAPPRAPPGLAPLWGTIRPLFLPVWRVQRAFDALVRLHP